MVLYSNMYNSVRFKIKPESHKNLNKIWLNILSSWPTCTSLVEGNKVEIRAILLKRVRRVKTTLFNWILCMHRKRKDNVIAVSRCLTLEGEYHYNKGANNISKGHHAGRKRRNIVHWLLQWPPLELEAYKLGNSELYSAFCVSNPL